MQREQWNDIEWPHLTIYHDMPMVAGQRYYDYPPELPVRQHLSDLVAAGRHLGASGLWHQPADLRRDGRRAGAGVAAPALAQLRPVRRDQRLDQRGGAIRSVADPAGGQPYSLRIEGNAPLNPLIEDTDTCVIDATLVVLFAAAEILAMQKSESASLKLQKANQYRRMLIARLGAQQRNMKSLSKDGGHMGSLNDGTPSDALSRLHPGVSADRRVSDAGPTRGRRRAAGASLYYEIANFQAGMDLRKSALTAPAGTLRLLQNAHITQGGEIEKRAAFVYWCNAPAGSMGLCSVNNLVFTHLADGDARPDHQPTDTAIGVIHIAQPPGDTLQAMYSYDVFNGQIYAVFVGQRRIGGTITTASWSRKPTDKGTFVRTYKEKMYGVQGRNLVFSAVGDPTIWQDPPPDSSGNVAHNGVGVHQHRRERRRQREPRVDGSLLRQDGDLLVTCRASCGSWTPIRR